MVSGRGLQWITLPKRQQLEPLYSDTAGKFAVLAKTCRNALIGFVVLGCALYWSSKGQAAAVENKSQFLWKKFPKFVLGFLLILP